MSASKAAGAAFLFGLLAAALAPAQVVPPGGEFAPGWTKAGPPRTFQGQDLFNHIDGGAELFLEFGFTKLLVQAYSDGKAELTAAVYEMESATAALGIYLMKMGRETPFPEIAARNSSEEAQAAVIKGRFFLQVDNFGDPAAPRKTMSALANAILAGLPDEKPLPVLDDLPKAGLVPGSERLLRGPIGLQPYYTFGEGDILGLGGKIFAALGDYRNPDEITFSRLVIPYPDEEAAAAVFAGLKANLDPYLKILSSSASSFDFQDFQQKKGAVVLDGRTLTILFKQK